MNCLDVRRILAATPSSQEREVLQHLRECRSCARYAEQENMLSQRINDTLKIAVPDGLSSRILLQHGLVEEKRYRIRRHYWQALAASVLLTVGLVSGMLVVNYTYSLKDIAFNHVQDEKIALQVEDNIPLAQVNDMLAPYNLRLRQAIGRVDFAMPCHIHHHPGAHLVIDGKYGKVTILFMPKEYVMARETIQERGMQGLLLPVDGGSIAIIGQRRKQLEIIAARIDQALVHTAT